MSDRALPEITEIPRSGMYMDVGGARYHLSGDADGRLNIRIIDMREAGTPRLFTHQPAGNVLIIDPTVEASNE